jgi:hypothetical protein
MAILALPDSPVAEEPSRLVEFRALWKQLVLNDRAVEAKATEIVELVEAQDHSNVPLLNVTGEAWTTFCRLENELVALLYAGHRHLWATQAAAAALGHRDRAVVEGAVGPLFRENGSLGDIWKQTWLGGRMTSRSSEYRRLLRKRL